MSTKVKVSIIIVIFGLLAPLKMAEACQAYYIAPASSIIDLNAPPTVASTPVPAPVPVPASIPVPAPVPVNVSTIISNPDAANPDGVYHLPKAQAPATVAANYNPAPAVPQNGGFFADVCTNVNVNVNAQSPENQAVNQQTVSANVSVNKGPVYVQYSHTRTYCYGNTTTDPALAGINMGVQGIVSNQVTFGVSFTPASAMANVPMPVNVNTTVPNMGSPVPVPNSVKTASVMGAGGY
jgi:hypothetical protein